MAFRDRLDAGQQLATAVADARPPGAGQPVVLGLPRGGVPVAAVVAERLDAPLDVLVVRKLGAPGHPELGLGAIGEGGVRVLDDGLVARLGVGDDHLGWVTAAEGEELDRRVTRYRGGAAMTPVADRDVVLVDDGIATGGTVRAAIEVLRAAGVRHLTVAVPVAAADLVDDLRRQVDDVVVIHAPHRLGSVGEHYLDFSPTTDDEVVTLLARHGG